MYSSLVVAVLTSFFLLQSAFWTQIASQLELKNRDMSLYDKAGPYKVSALTVYRSELDKAEAEIRTFIWKHWRQRRRAYASLVIVSVEGEPQTTSFFVEPDEGGRWRISLMEERTQVGQGGLRYRHYEVNESFAYAVERIAPPQGKADRVSIPPGEKEPGAEAYRLFLKDERGVEISVF